MIDKVKPSPEMTLGDYFQNVYLRRRELRANSQYQYGVAIASVDRWSGGPVRLADLKDDLVNDWIAWLCKGTMAPATARNRRRHLLTLWRAASEDHLAADQQHRLRAINAPWIPPRAWTYEQVQQLLAAADRLKGYHPAARWPRDSRHPLQMPRAIIWGLLIRLAWDTGLRQGDIFALKASQLGSDGVIEVVQSKTQRWLMTKVHPETLAAIRASFPPERETLAPYLLCAEHFRREFAALVKIAGIPKGSFKRLRKSSATDVERRYPGMGGSHLGHSSSRGIAQTNYLDPTLLIGDKPMPQPLREASAEPVTSIAKPKPAPQQKRKQEQPGDLVAVLRHAINASRLSDQMLSHWTGVNATGITRFSEGSANLKLSSASKLAAYFRLWLGDDGPDIGTSLRAKILADGIPANELARQTGINQTSISDFLRGSDMTLGRASAIAACLGIELKKRNKKPKN
jgi:integrase/plasmid maintenance system antidote protein VapI